MTPADPETCEACEGVLVLDVSLSDEEFLRSIRHPEEAILKAHHAEIARLKAERDRLRELVRVTAHRLSLYHKAHIGCIGNGCADNVIIEKARAEEALK